MFSEMFLSLALNGLFAKMVIHQYSGILVRICKKKSAIVFCGIFCLLVIVSFHSAMFGVTYFGKTPDACIVM